MSSTTYLFAFDEAAKAAIPAINSTKMTIGKDLPIPSSGEEVAFGPLPGEWFLVKQRQFEYDGAGNLTITINLTRTSQRAT